MQKHLWAFFRSHRAVVFTFLSILAIRLALFLVCEIHLTFDSYEYISIDGFALFSGAAPNIYRVPVYPMLIDALYLLFGNNNLIVLCILQFIVSMISIIYLYRCLNMIMRHQTLNLFLTFLYAGTMAVMGWDKTILTESFALSLTVFMIYHLIAYLYIPSFGHVVNIAIIVAVGAFLRPTFALYAGLVLGFFVLRVFFAKLSLRQKLASVLISLIPMLLLAGYALDFQRAYGVFSISNSYLGQQLSVLQTSSLYKLGDDPELVAKIERAVAKYDYSYETTVREVLLNEPGADFARIATFVERIKARYPVKYMQALGKIITTSGSKYYTSYFALTQNSGLLKQALGYALTVIYPQLTFLYMDTLTFVVLELGILIYFAIKKKMFSWLHFGLFGCILLTWLTALLGTNDEFPRTAITVLPFCTLAIQSYLGLLSGFLRGYKPGESHVLAKCKQIAMRPFVHVAVNLSWIILICFILLCYFAQPEETYLASALYGFALILLYMVLRQPLYKLDRLDAALDKRSTAVSLIVAVGISSALTERLYQLRVQSILSGRITPAIFIKLNHSVGVSISLLNDCLIIALIAAGALLLPSTLSVMYSLCYYLRKQDVLYDAR